MFALRLVFCTIALAALACVGCTKEERRVNGVVCASSDQCVSSLCYNAVCLDPEADDDGDGLLNKQEAKLKTHPFKADTDDDGPQDGEEVGDDLDAPRDADGDNDPKRNDRHDALESLLEDSDRDCIEDQFDPNDEVVEVDSRVVAELACPSEGVCGADGAQVEASCDRDQSPPVRTCDYSGVENYDDDPDGETTCDTLDNDCDGFVDEGIEYEDLDGKALTLGEPCGGTGACAEASGLVECYAGLAICSVNAGGTGYAGSEEAPCNNLDDDCDGSTDDGITLLDPDGAEELPVGAPCAGPGVCGFGAGGEEQGVVECVSLVGENVAVCSTGPGGSMDASEAEICDTLDNDCDGFIDEGIVWIAADGVEVGLGEPCGQGACAGGEVVCIAGEPSCSTAEKASGGAESCNGLDDDCDGEVDETDGLEFNCPAIGVCADLEPAKVGCNDDVVFCSYIGVEGFEVGEETSCNGLDDDCDGFVDESLAAPDGALLGAPCQGQGSCSGFTGEIVCGLDSGGANASLCSVDLDQGTIELCNGIDDDCDGLTDDDPTEAPQDLGCLNVGVCVGQEESGAVCVDGAWLCAYSVVDDFESQESTCDGLDNDCDGQVDEGVAKSFDPGLYTATETQPAHRVRWPMAATNDGTVFLFGGLHARSDEVGPGVILGDLWSLQPGTSTWTRLDVEEAGGPGPRWGHAVSYDSVFHVFLVHGGLDTHDEGADPLEDLWAFHPDTGTWELVSQSSELPSLPARAWHTFTSVGGGVSIIAGGGEASDETLLGTLSTLTTEDGTGLACAWSVGQLVPADRRRHAAVHHPEIDALWLIGGAGEGDAPLLTLSLDAPTEWKAGLPDDTAVLPTSVDSCAVVEGEDVLLFGGRKGTIEALGFGSSPVVLGWRFSTSGEQVLAEALPTDELPPMAGCLALSGGELGVTLIPGAATENASWSRIHHFDPAAQTWTSPSAWAGLPPRAGAAVAVRFTDGAAWVFGGARAPGHHPLQDAWRRESDGSWTSVVSPLALDATGVDKTRPALEGATALWDPVGERVLLYGGVAHVEGASLESTDLWAFLPSVGGFQEMDDQGTPPSGLRPRPVFAHHLSGQSAWLAGVMASEAGGQAPVAEGSLVVHELSLSVLAWSEAPLVSKDVGVSTSLASVVGGASEAGLDLVHLTTTGALVATTTDGSSWTEGALVAQGPYTGFATGVYDPMTRISLIWAMAEDGAPTVLAIDHASSASTELSLSAASALSTNAALALHPVDGAIGMGGVDSAGVTRSARTLFGQSCP